MNIFKNLFSPDDCDSEDGSTCTNGACLDHLCHCNDGFGGCNCRVAGLFHIRYSAKSFYL